MSAVPADDWADDPGPLDPLADADRLAASVKPCPPAPPPPPPEEPRRELEFPDVGAFVTEQLSPLFRRPLGAGRTWCPEWWRHAEAILRLRALWLAWEHLRWEAALGMAVWTRDHLDPQMAVLLDADGPFHGCHPEKGHNAGRLEPLPVVAPPAGLFTEPNGGNGDNVPNAPTGGRTSTPAEELLS
jgi:hypothetical protein